MNTKIENTKLKLLNAYAALAKTTDPANVTVTALCKEAGINRSTFYKHYSIPSDIADEFTTRLINETYESIHGREVDLPVVLTHLCHSFHAASADGIMGKIITISSFEAILTKFMTKLAGDNVSLLKHGSVYFIAGGLNSVLKQWLVNEPDIPVEQIVDLMVDYIRLFM